MSQGYTNASSNHRLPCLALQEEAGDPVSLESLHNPHISASGRAVIAPFTSAFTGAALFPVLPATFVLYREEESLCSPTSTPIPDPHAYFCLPPVLKLRRDQHMRMTDTCCQPDNTSPAAPATKGYSGLHKTPIHLPNAT